MGGGEGEKSVYARACVCVWGGGAAAQEKSVNPERKTRHEKDK